jgi:hypothetical protein
MSDLRTICIFISSPADVRPERLRIAGTGGDDRTFWMSDEDVSSVRVLEACACID